MKVKIIKRLERQTILEANSEASPEPPETVAGKTISATVESWVDDLKRKSEVDAALLKKLFKT